MYKDNNITPIDLTLWLQTNINAKDLVFDKCADIFNIIVKKLEENKLHLKVDNNVLMIKLCKFLYENSTN